MKLLVFGLSLYLISQSFLTNAQEKGDINELKQEILSIRADVENITLNLEKSKSKFQRGIFVATLGYTITIVGGLMLGRENDELGQGLLVAGGVTGGIGTYMLVDAFKYLGRVRLTTKEKPI
ncbi:hypothetical protein [Fulvivirga lutimaris]|uniref:hypothetical protein n=1 Tax=Fulvivirga lutimaris TaxID=1819566 RepID=UPI0012BC92CE|nr:hypothetical protein [Fulvivirga lutimaris]MTI41110.1 hypothetical protein [Fulvivirga lutimaris]